MGLKIPLLPSYCALCDSPSAQKQSLCSHCNKAIPRIKAPCHNCGMPLPEAYAGLDHNICGHCIQNRPFFDLSRISTLYADPISWLVQRFKFNGQLHHIPTLTQLLLEKLPTTKPELPECIIPVPLHHTRLRQRGFNQALELARPIGKKLGIPLDYGNCIRIINTPQQSELTASQRLRNVRKAFTLRKPNLNIKHIAILDDVVTTGATVNAIAKLLKKSGVEKVEVWAIARAVIDKKSLYQTAIA